MIDIRPKDSPMNSRTNRIPGILKTLLMMSAFAFLGLGATNIPETQDLCRAKTHTVRQERDVSDC
jgi:hypothetical protein